MKSIFTKIFFSYFLVILLLTFFILFFAINIIRENEQNELIKSLKNINHSLDAGINRLIVEKKEEQIDSLVRSLGNKIDYRITIINTDGRVLADSQKNPKKMNNHSDRPEIVKALSKGIGVAVRFSYTVKKDMLYVALPIKSNHKIYGISRFSIDMSDFEKIISSLRLKLVFIITIVFIVSILIAFIFTNEIAKPIKMLTALFNSVSEGDFSKKAKIKGNDEFKHLASSFNVMVDRLKSLMEKTNQQKEELNNIISSIQEGLVVLDFQGRILLFNNSFSAMVGSVSIESKFYWEILRDDSIEKLFRKVQESNLNASSEIQLQDEFYICSANILNQKHEIVLIFHNISEWKKIENIKKDFVINVSHELRTPLTVIKGYVETIEDDIDEKNKKYLGIIKNHTNRLINIVQDLLSISQLEQQNFKLDFSKINIKSLFNDLQNTFEQRILSKNLELTFMIDENTKSLWGDAFKLEQMFINLIDNAIKYTEKGYIKISATAISNFVRFEVLDTGVGIPLKDKDRIFERFYTVDKSRSRQLTGTGLGLSIVKHIVNLHKGKIQVESEVDRGSKFIIHIPISNK